VKIARNNQELEQILENYKLDNPTHTIGFVPTMGALHQGHMSLVKQAKIKSNFLVVSVFVNPTQFNESADLDKYPRTESADIELLKSNNCDLIYLPSVEDIYPNKKSNYYIDLVGLDKVMEGKYRENHFDGVCMVVERLFSLVKPDYAFFGKKDFQQVAIIDYMVKDRELAVEIISCPIKRELSGLAMSSRNMLLSAYEKNQAVIINDALSSGVSAYKRGFKIDMVMGTMLSIFYRGSLQLEYIEIVDNVTLQKVSELNDNCTVCIAAYCGSVRLIDNFQFSR
jgi:pantoate--beta-alanine ligase